MMMADNEDLGLSLSLSSSNPAAAPAPAAGAVCRNPHSNRSPFHLNLMPSLLFSASSSTSTNSSSLPVANPPSKTLHKASWLESFPSSDRTSEAPCKSGAAVAVADPRSFLRGIDVNRLPASGGEEEEAGVSSPNSTISSVSGKRSEREATVGDDLDLSRGGVSDDDDGDTSRKKLRLSKDQSAVLEDTFKEHNTLNPKQKLALAKRLGLRPRQVEVWFQNRRARTKLKQTEVDCEFLKRCCEQMTEDNRRLQKEVQELRALKLSPQFYMQMTPPTTLTMCPSCERVAAPTSAPAAADTRPRLNPWAVAAPVPIRPFEALHPRS